MKKINLSCSELTELSSARDFKKVIFPPNLDKIVNG